MELTQLMDEVRSTRDQGKLWTRTRELLDEARKELEVREENWTEAGRKEGTPEHELVRALQWRVATIKEFLSL
ncbi:hypothetical protein FEM03_18440 [Phragmitibacter flavus]|uniref:Uncharacterized protein n=1 Tax=Phragmitibacter flavus TaxID=2576071 RepID=A0A5R8KAK8_9BACT|nr:hypothetical protein [Phragmitibacter flavus]TLD69348.1 hypothetical protein FEM03_18440 [Phragmitibacter flavus]